MEPTQLLIWIVSSILGYVILFYVVKAAVKNAMSEVNETRGMYKNSASDKLPNPQQALVQKKYDRGEMSFAEYQKEWNRLS